MPPTTPGTPPPAQGEPPGGGITMLGAEKTGKTTFLAALQIALLRSDLGWSLRGDNRAAAQALVSFTGTMIDEHLFPQATSTQIEAYRWSLEAYLRRAVIEWHWWGFRRRDKYIRIPLNLADAGGEISDGRRLGREESQRLIQNLVRSSGIVLFFDPMSEFQRGDAFRHTYGVLTHLKTQAARYGRLPHYVAVCITKFDEIKVFRSAQTLRVIEYGPEKEAFPHVPEEYAKGFFEQLIRLSRSDAGGLILPLLMQTFHEDRIRFFVTSAIGFYLDPGAQVFDPDDFWNHIPGDPNRIRGGIYPINVLEPVLWLGRNIPRVAR
jgi:hypothetical protein